MLWMVFTVLVCKMAHKNHSFLNKRPQHLSCNKKLTVLADREASDFLKLNWGLNQASEWDQHNQLESMVLYLAPWCWKRKTSPFAHKLIHWWVHIPEPWVITGINWYYLVLTRLSGYFDGIMHSIHGCFPWFHIRNQPIWVQTFAVWGASGAEFGPWNAASSRGVPIRQIPIRHWT